MNYKTRCDLPHISDNFLYDILRSRGIADPDSYMQFENIEHTSWRDLSQIDEAIPILEDAISGKYSVGLIADCDVDGYCSAAITYLYLKDHNPDLEIRMFFHSGKAHGIDDNIFRALSVRPVDILIIPDASSNELDEHEALAEMGARILVMDHHETDITEDPYAVRVNNQISEGAINKTLCGAGVTWFVMKAYDELHGTRYAEKYIDLCAVALVGDMMDLRHSETHYLVNKGLSNITNPGLRAFVEENSYSLGGRIDLYPMDVAFYIAPLINAVIRVGTAEQKESIFTALINGTAKVPSTKRGAKSGDMEIAGEQAARIAKNCKALQARIIERAMETLEAKIVERDLLQHKILLIIINSDDDIPSTLTGLVAMKLTAKYHRPTMILRECDDGVLKGSTRAEADTEIGSFKDYMLGTGLVEYAEGHALANGAGLRMVQVGNFINHTDNDLKDVDFNEKYLCVDYVFSEKENVSGFIFNIEDGRMVWGQNVEEPTFVVENIPLTRANVQLMKNNCLKFVHNNVTYVIFKNEQAVEDFTRSDKMMVTVYGKGSINEWCGRRNAQVIINDYQISSCAYIF